MSVSKGTLKVNGEQKLAHFTFSETVSFPTAHQTVTIKSGNIPSDYRPNPMIIRPCHNYTGGVQLAMIGTNGNIEAVAYTTGARSCSINATWSYA